MTNQAFPITPPLDLVTQWFLAARAMPVDQWVTDVATAAAQWGWEQRGATTEAELQQRADQELEACEEWLNKSPYGASLAVTGVIEQLRIARRPKPPSLRKQAYDALDTYIYGEPDPKDKERTYNTIRQALEQLND